MAFKVTMLISIMLLLGVLMSIVDLTGAQVGVCNGKLGAGLPSDVDTIALYKQNGIKSMRIYDPALSTLKALEGTNIKLAVGIANSELPRLASDTAYAASWVQTYLKSYPTVSFSYVVVGNEVNPGNSATAQFAPYVLPAIQNIYNSLGTLQVPVTTSLDLAVLESSYPPSAGAFREDVKSFITPIVTFLSSKNAPVLVNVYPYFAYAATPEISLAYATFTASVDVVSDPPYQYQNLFDAMLDAFYVALEKVGAPNLRVVVSETGWPTAGGKDTSINVAQTYNTNLVSHIKKGTPRRPSTIETFIFAMYDEDQKPGQEVERHWGLFNPATKQLKYQISLSQ